MWHGRTGSLWAYQQTGVTPDALTVAKALGGGLPIGALVTGPRLADVFAPGDHGSTFAGGPLVASAALAALEMIDEPGLLARVASAARSSPRPGGAAAVLASTRTRADARVRVGRRRARVVRRALLDAALSSTRPGPPRFACCRR